MTQRLVLFVAVFDDIYQALDLSAIEQHSDYGCADGGLESAGPGSL
ncbi:MAG: hypothetical protein M1600_07295 [Firmicutes bacterium]|jgi:hypothetical protein|nr:hypothetical protein [Bacillota bacterium]